MNFLSLDDGSLYIMLVHKEGMMMMPWEAVAIHDKNWELFDESSSSTRANMK